MGVVDYDAKLIDLSDKEYYGSYGEYLSVSLLKRFSDDPLAFDEYMENRKDNEKPTDALVLGQATHVAIMEGWDSFDKNYVVSDELVNPKTGKSYGRTTQKFLASCESLDVSPWRALATTDVESIRSMEKAVRTDVQASCAISECTNIEMAIRGRMYGVPFQGKLDGCSNDGLIVDLKTMRPDSTVFEQVVKYRYAWQAYCYLKLYSEATGIPYEDCQFQFVFVTKEEEPKVNVILFTHDDVIDAMDQVTKALKAYRVSSSDRRLALLELEN